QHQSSAISSTTHTTSFFPPFFCADSATTEIYTLSLHDALPICSRRLSSGGRVRTCSAASSRTGRSTPSSSRRCFSATCTPRAARDRKSTRLNSSHVKISYAVFCLKKKNKKKTNSTKYCNEA